MGSSLRKEKGGTRNTSELKVGQKALFRFQRSGLILKPRLLLNF